MARPILRLATRITRRTRATAVAIAFACMVLVGALSLADGLANGIASVADRVAAGPAVYIRGDELLSSDIDPLALGNRTGDFIAMRVHPAELEINGIAIAVISVALESYQMGVGTTWFPTGSNDLSLDVGLRARIVAASGIPVGTSGNLSVFGGPPRPLPIVAPPTNRSELFPDDWAYVRADLFVAMSPTQGGTAQAILQDGPLDPTLAASLGLSRLETLGAVGFVRGSVAEVQSSLRILALVIAVVIGLIVHAAMSLEVHARSREIAILRSLGASAAAVARGYAAQALVLALAGAILGGARGSDVADPRGVARGPIANPRGGCVRDHARERPPLDQHEPRRKSNEAIRGGERESGDLEPRDPSRRTGLDSGRKARPVLCNRRSRAGALRDLRRSLGSRGRGPGRPARVVGR